MALNTDALINDIYQKGLGRAPDAGGAAYWANQAKTKNWDAATLSKAILGTARDMGVTVNPYTPPAPAPAPAIGMDTMNNTTQQNGGRLISRPNPHGQLKTPPTRTVAPATSGALTPQKARELISQSMISGVPTSVFNQYGGYDKVSELAGQMGMPLASVVTNIPRDQIANTGFVSTPAQIASGAQSRGADFSPSQAVSWMNNANAQDYAVKHNLATVELAKLAVQNDPRNAGKPLDQIDWSFLQTSAPSPISTPTYTPPTAAPTAPSVVKYKAETRNINPSTETVQGQLTNLVSADNPLMRRAKYQALSRMAGRGLLNSSLASTAGYAAMLDKALPIAQQDAQAYNARTGLNLRFLNDAAKTNSNWGNKLKEDRFTSRLGYWANSNLSAQDFSQKRTLQELSFAQSKALENLKTENSLKLKGQLLAQEYQLKDKLQQLANTPSIYKQYQATYTAMVQHLNNVLANDKVDAKSKRTIVNNTIDAMKRLNASAGVLGAKLPEFNFSDYFIAAPP